MSRVDSGAMRRYDDARARLAALLSELESLLDESRRETLRHVRARIERDTFVLAVVGEFSSGKSFLLNALLEKYRYENVGGARAIVGLLATDINPSTAAITEIAHGTHDEAVAIFEDGRREQIPLDSLNRFTAVGKSDVGLLHDATGDDRDAPTRVVVKTNSSFLERGFVVADTPGLASINPAHRRATLHFLPNADAVLYLIDTQQPFTEGDASFLGIVQQHIDSIFIVQTKIDLWTAAQSDDRPSWEHAYDRIARMAALHAHGTYVYAVSARDYVTGRLDDDAATIEASRFRPFLAALDASLIRRTGRARLARAGAGADEAARDEVAHLDRDVAMLQLDEARLRDARAAVLPKLEQLDRDVELLRKRLVEAGFALRARVSDAGEQLVAELEQTLGQTLDTADIGKIRDRERLHLLVDRIVARVTGEFASQTAQVAADELHETLERARSVLTLRWSPAEATARAFGAHAGSSLWSGDLHDAIAATIVLEAIGTLAIGFVHDVASRFSSRPRDAYMKRELTLDLRMEIFPRLRTTVSAFAADVGTRLARAYDDLAQALARGLIAAHDAELGSIERALAAHAAGSVVERLAAEAERRAAIARVTSAIDGLVADFMGHAAEIAAADPGPAEIHAAHADASSFDRGAYDRGLRPERWRVAVLGALRRGKSALINAFAGREVLTDDAAGSIRFPVHVRYGERDAAYALDRDGTWTEIPFERASAQAALSPVLLLVPWTLPEQLVLVHAPAFDSGDESADDVNVVAAAHASEVLCLFSRQLSDRELDLYQRVAEFGRPMLFAHTIADNETARERRGVVELAGEYLRQRNIACERIFTVSSHEFLTARRDGRAPAGWNETEALRATLEAHAEAHMTRLARLAHARESIAREDRPVAPSRDRVGLLGRLLGKGH